jgi:hypothetical protein
MNNGNLVGLTSSYQTTDGVTHTAADVWFVVKPVQQTQASSTNLLAQAIGQFTIAAAQPSNAGASESFPDGQLTLTTQMVEAMRAFTAQDAVLRIGSIGQSTANSMANAGSLAVGIAGDEKVKARNSTNADVPGLFLNK